MPNHTNTTSAREDRHCVRPSSIACCCLVGTLPYERKLIYYAALSGMLAGLALWLAAAWVWSR